MRKIVFCFLCLFLFLACIGCRMPKIEPSKKQVPLLVVIEAGESERRITVNNSDMMLPIEAIKRINEELLNRNISQIDVICNEKRDGIEYIDGFLSEVKKIAGRNNLQLNTIYSKSDSVRNPKTEV